MIEAQLTLLLQLSSARRSLRAEVTDDLQLIGKLVHCKVNSPSCKQLAISITAEYSQQKEDGDRIWPCRQCEADDAILQVPNAAEHQHAGMQQ